MEEAKPADLFAGVADSHLAVEVRRTAWEGRPKRVRAPYSKTEAVRLDPEYRGTRETPWETGWTTIQA